jgi:pimeloyl-ACP methyl ester carboxylesterase
VGHEHQDKLAVIVLHGFGNSNVNFFKMVKEFAKERKTYMIDLPGFGLSSRPKFV